MKAVTLAAKLSQYLTLLYQMCMLMKMLMTSNTMLGKGLGRPLQSQKWQWPCERNGWMVKRPFGWFNIDGNKSLNSKAHNSPLSRVPQQLCTPLAWPITMSSVCVYVCVYLRCLGFPEGREGFRLGKVRVRNTGVIVRASRADLGGCPCL